MASAPYPRIQVLQAGRGLAALGVVAFHTFSQVHEHGSHLPAIIEFVAVRGKFGVDFFFVLSGFIIYHANHDRAARPGWAPRFAFDRLTRIFLPYWPVAIAAALATYWIPNPNLPNWNWPGVVTLLPGLNSVLWVAWTLQHELVFYALALIFLHFGRPVAGAFLCGAILVLLSLAGIDVVDGARLIDLEFIFGIVAAWCLLNRRANNSGALVIGGLALAVAYYLSDNIEYRATLGLSIAMLLLWLVRLEKSDRITVPAPLVVLGDASYAIYLVHLPLIACFWGMMDGTHPIIVTFFWIGASVFVGIAYHLTIERPLLRWARRRRDRPLSTVPAVE